MNCVLFVADARALDPVEVAKAVATAGVESGPRFFDRHYECSGRASAVAATLMTGVYPRVHGVGVAAPGRGWSGSTLPGLLGGRGFECVTVGLAGLAGSIVFNAFDRVGEETLGGGGLQNIEPAAVLDGWLARRVDHQRPFFALVWGSRSEGRVASVSGLFDVLGKQNLLGSTAVLALASNARERSELPAAFPPPPVPLVLFHPYRLGGESHVDFVTDTVDLCPTVLSLTGQDVADPSGGMYQGVPLVAADGSVSEHGRRAVFGDLADERSGVRCRVVHGAGSCFAEFDLDPSRSGGRLSWSLLVGLVRGPGWRRRVLRELVAQGSAERASGAGGDSATGGMSSWGRRAIERWLADSHALAEKINRQGSMGDEAALRARLRGLGYLG